MPPIEPSSESVFVPTSTATRSMVATVASCGETIESSQPRTISARRAESGARELSASVVPSAACRKGAARAAPQCGGARGERRAQIFRFGCAERGLQYARVQRGGHGSFLVDVGVARADGAHDFAG